MENRELSALIALLDDPDAEVYTQVCSRLLAYGTEIIPRLENAWERTMDPSVQKRIEEVVHKIQYKSLQKDFRTWAESNSSNLLNGAYLVTRYQYPTFDVKAADEKIERIRRTIWLELSHHLSPLEQINIFNHIFYTVLEFTPKASSQNYFIHRTLENKCGNGLMLGLLYLIIGQDLDIPVYGVSLPGRFFLTYAREPLQATDKDGALRGKLLFYINPLTRGTIYSRSELIMELKKVGERIEPSDLVPCDNKTIISLLLENLIDIYRQDALVSRMEEIRQLLRIIS
ncbi:MAG: hypothetical protein KatS3mg031_2700 [Chitinophagales bacterium]|nr:MAG: hypothetical protein KatS3mg031_2700 [Chitinophagales bacterium]